VATQIIPASKHAVIFATHIVV